VQLVSFQIKECSGFPDSGEIDLQDPTNLIYVLGRNSSGKTSFLTALSYFAPNLTPRDYQNFKNFDSSTRAPYLISKFREGLHFKVVVDATVDHKSTKDELQEEYDIPDK
jgi:AAA15 family ATPase/GTPase